MAARATERWELRRLRETRGAGIALSGPEVLRRVAVDVGAFDVVVRKLFPSLLRAVKRASN